MDIPKPLAFVLMPFDDQDDVFDHVIRPRLENEYDVRRADTNVHQRNVVNDIVEGIQDAYLIVADLTNLNPNVMWELGVAHAMGKRTLLLTQDDPEDVPFDLSSYRVRQYSTQIGRLAKEDAEYIERVAREALAGTAEFRNPVLDYCPDIDLSPPSPWNEAEAGSPEAASPGWLDLAAESEETQAALNRHYQGLSEYTEAVGAKMSQRTEALNRWQSEGSPGGAPKARELTEAAASDLFGYAEELKEELDGIEECGAALRNTLLPFLESSPLGEGEDRAEGLQMMEELRGTLSHVIQVSRQSKGQVQKFKDVMSSLRGTSKRLDVATSRVAHRLGNMISEMDRHESLLQDGVDTLDRRIERERC